MLCIVKETYDVPGESENVVLDSRNLSPGPQESWENWEGRDFLGNIGGKDVHRRKRHYLPTQEEFSYTLTTVGLKKTLLYFSQLK